jgi:hypothetical protein
MKEDAELFDMLLKRANKYHDGHLTIMKFTTNWRVCLDTPEQIMDDDVVLAGWAYLA